MLFRPNYIRIISLKRIMSIGSFVHIIMQCKLISPTNLQRREENDFDWKNDDDGWCLVNQKIGDPVLMSHLWYCTDPAC